jgi:hypothetical protein
MRKRRGGEEGDEMTSRRKTGRRGAGRRAEGPGDARGEGRCEICGSTIARSAAAPHVASCLGQGSPPDAEGRFAGDMAPFLHLLLEGRHHRAYWMHVAARSDASLEDLDGFIREEWVECCGHLSVFKVGRTRYESHPEEQFGEEHKDELLRKVRDAYPLTPEQHQVIEGLFFKNQPFIKSMRVGCSEALPPGTKAAYEYDFGSTTELVVNSLGDLGAHRGLKVRLLARNLPPPLRCAGCGGTATLVCSACGGGPDSLWCSACSGKNRCGIESLLGVANSPRSGVCGYSG